MINIFFNYFFPFFITVITTKIPPTCSFKGTLSNPFGHVISNLKIIFIEKVDVNIIALPRGFVAWLG